MDFPIFPISNKCVFVRSTLFHRKFLLVTNKQAVDQILQHFTKSKRANSTFRFSLPRTHQHSDSSPSSKFSISCKNAKVIRREFKLDYFNDCAFCQDFHSLFFLLFFDVSTFSKTIFVINWEKFICSLIQQQAAKLSLKQHLNFKIKFIIKSLTSQNRGENLRSKLNLSYRAHFNLLRSYLHNIRTMPHCMPNQSSRTELKHLFQYTILFFSIWFVQVEEFSRVNYCAIVLEKKTTSGEKYP